MNNNRTFNFIFIALFPFWTLLLSLIKFSSDNSKNYFWYGCSFLGAVHIFNPIGGSGSDGIRYAYNLTRMHYDRLNFNTIISYFYAEDGKLDIYQTLITFFISLFTDNAHYLFLVNAIVFGYFYSRNVWLVLDECKITKLYSWIWIFIIAYILVNPIWNINGVRMWTALQVLMYGILSVEIANENRKIYWVILSIFVHFSFIIPVIIYLIYKILPKKRLNVYFIIFYCCVMFNTVNLQTLREQIYSIVPHQLSDKVDSYMSDTKLEDKESAISPFAFHVTLARDLSRYYMLLTIAFLWIVQKKLITITRDRNIIILMLIFGSFFEVLSGIPSFERFFTIQFFLFYCLILLLIFNPNNESVKYYSYFKISSLILVYPIIFGLRTALDFYGVSLFCGNFITAIMINDNEPLISYIKSIL